MQGALLQKYRESEMRRSLGGHRKLKRSGEKFIREVQAAD